MIIKDIIELKKEYYNRTGCKLHLLCPKSFNEKMQWLKLFYKNYQLVICSDKILAKKYLKKQGLGEYIPKTILTCDDAKKINEDLLPEKCMIKTTHGSGTVYKYEKCEQRKFIRIQNEMNRCLKIPYWDCTKEWIYNVIKPRLLIEEYLEDGNNEYLTDYKFMCFNGKCELIFLVTERQNKEGMFVDFYDAQWNKLPFKRMYNTSDKYAAKPLHFDKMMQIAEKLSKNFPFLRVDFYIVDNKLFIGELTFFPGSGWEVFDPVDYDYYYGKLLKLPGYMECIKKYIEFLIFKKHIREGKIAGITLWED